MDREFKFVIVGSGNMSRTYMQAAGKLEGVRIAGVVSRRKKLPEGVSPDAGLAVADCLGALECDYDAVIVATPNGTHHAWAVEAASRGKHVLTEKPLDVTIAAMDGMIGTCRQADVRLGVAYQKRMYPDNVVLKELLEAGALGRVLAADVYVKYFRGDDYYDSSAYRGTRDIDGGGPFMQQGSHDIDLYCWLFGKPQRVVSMLGTLNHSIEVEDHGVAVFRYENGMIGSITASTVTKPGFSGRLEIHAEAGSVIMENDRIKTWAVDDIANPSQAGDMKIHDGAASAAVTDTAGHEMIIRDFVDAVRDGRDPAVTGESARLATELILDVYAGAV